MNGTIGDAAGSVQVFWRDIVMLLRPADMTGEAPSSQQVGSVPSQPATPVDIKDDEELLPLVRHGTALHCTAPKACIACLRPGLAFMHSGTHCTGK